MIPPEVTAQMATLGLTAEQARAVAGMLQAVEEATEAGRLTARQARNKRYYEARRERLNSDAKAKGGVLVKTRLKASESVLKRLNQDAPRARVDDNLLPLEGTGSEEGRIVSQGSNEPFETIVPEGSGTLARRKQNVELFQTVVSMWNDLASGLRLVAVRDITPTRQAAILARSGDLVKTYDFPDALAGWRKLMGLVRGSPFLRGERNGFRCDFDFVTRASSFTKIMEGKYEANQATRR